MILRLRGRFGDLRREFQAEELPRLHDDYGVGHDLLVAAIEKIAEALGEGRLIRVKVTQGLLLEATMVVGSDEHGCRVVRRRGKELLLVRGGVAKYVREEY